MKDMIAELERLSNTLSYTDKYLQELSKANTYLDTVINSAEKALSSSQTNSGRMRKEVFDSKLPAMLLELKEFGKEVLQSEIELATVASPEFNTALFKAPLLQAAKKDGNISIIVSRHGWESRIIVVVDMDPTAGTLDQYAAGVTAFRNLSASRGKDPEKASAYWRKNVFTSPNQSRYIKTIKYRLSQTGALAPFWKLLDMGSVPMTSDWEGTAYPMNNPTLFTINTALKIKQRFKMMLNNEKSMYIDDSTELVKRISVAKEYKRKLQVRLDFLQSINPHDLDTFIKKYGDDLYVSKLIRILDVLLTSGKYKTTADGRIEITAPGATSRVRPSLKSIVSSFGLEL